MTQNIKDLADDMEQAAVELELAVHLNHDTSHLLQWHGKAREVLREQVDALARDAARYRWLRDDGINGDHLLVVARMYNGELRCEVSDYDADIDKAMKEKT